MSRRRLRVVYSSSSSDDDQPQNPNPNPNNPQFDDEIFDEAEQQQQHHEHEHEEIEIPSSDPIPSFETVTLNSSTPTISDPPPVTISDEDFLDVDDNLSPPSPPPATSTAVVEEREFEASDCPVNDWLRKLGLNLRRDWLNSCKLGLASSIQGFDNFDVETKAKLCFGQFLVSDMNYVGAGVLPPNVHQLHLVELPGPFVLQADEVINISCPLKERYKNSPRGIKRCLKLSMTDGVQRVFGMEYRSIPSKILETLGPAGFKVVIRNVNVRRGLLMLVPEVLEILGGSVEELEEARLRLVHEVNKPPRGKRTRTGVVPPLSTRATLAAWPQNGVSNDRVPPNGANQAPRNIQNSALHAATQIHENVQGADTIIRNVQAHPTGRETMEVFTTGQSNQHSTNGVSAQRPIARETAQCSISIETVRHSASEETAELATSREATEPPPQTESIEVFTTGQTNQHSTSGVSAQRPIGRETAKCSISIETAKRSISIETARHSVSEETAELATSREATEPPPRTENTGFSSFSTSFIENEDIHMVEHVEHPFVLSEGMELPFTYLASISAKWAMVQESEPFVRGKIKCFLTGVKGFKFKQRSTYELQVYVDDGSLISEILVHHNVVQKAIGYSPVEVTAALGSSDEKIVSDMKETLTQFQMFLVNFEGIVIVEMNENSTVPVAVEMNEGCSASDAWLLLQRLKPVTSSQLCQNDQPAVIHLSP